MMVVECIRNGRTFMMEIPYIEFSAVRLDVYVC